MAWSINLDNIYALCATNLIQYINMLTMTWTNLFLKYGILFEAVIINIDELFWKHDITLLCD